VCREARVAVGGACASDDACLVGARCVEGTCRAGGGGECEASSACGAVERCETRFVSRCVARRALGEPCDFGGCVAGATCDFAATVDGVSGVCVPTPGPGAPCTGECVEGHYCLYSDLGREGTCVPYGDVGAPCGSGIEGPAIPCREGLVCLSDVCVLAPGPGAPCDLTGQCAEGLRCRFFDGAFLCADPVPPGESCSTAGFDDPCTPDHFCDFATGTCIPRGGLGAPCDFGGCVPGLECVFDFASGTSSCRTPPVLGEPCSSVCAGEAYCGYEETGGMCKPAVCGTVPDYVGGSVGPDPGPGPEPAPPPRPIPARFRSARR
jgi:hypothetical protein